MYCFVRFCDIYLYQQYGTNKNIIKKMILKIEYVERIRKDDELLLELAKANEVRVATVERWLREKNQILTTAGNLLIIKKRLEVLDSDELLVEETIAEVK